MKTFSYIFLTLILLLTSCVTTKKSKKEVGWLKKQMHDMNARYNGYFNAKELYKASVVQLSDQHEDNYNKVLEIFPLGSEDDRKSVEANMDKAIEKVVKVAALHEPSKWVDDCYVMMGKAQFLKADYESAQETFEYFVDDFNPKDPNSRVYEKPDRRQTSQDKKKIQAQERKIKTEQRKKAKKEEEKDRKQKAKEREKERKQREKERKQRAKDRKKGKRTPKKPVAVKETPKEETPAETTAIASTDNQVPLSEDDAYLAEIADRERKAKNKKIEEEGSGGGFLKHKPAFYEGMYWLARTFIAREKWIEANYFLEKLETDPGVNDEIRNITSVVRADYYLQQKDYRKAIPALQAALEVSKDRKVKARMAYILAQSHQMAGNSSEAYAAFDRVSKFKTDFEMELHADMNKLKNQWAAGAASSDATTSKLNRMAKQDKNERHRGSLYSAIAEIKLVEGDNAGGIEYFQKALASAGNNTTKSEIYYRLGTLYFGNEKYREAKTYYDSTLTVMTEKDERFKSLERVSASLKDIAKNIDIIYTQDSLLKLSNLSQSQLEKFAKEKAEKAWSDEQAKKASEEEAGGFSTTQAVLAGNSKFFAYNPTAKQKGQRDFNKIWGNRPLEDDWRRSQKSSSTFDQEVVEQVVSNTIPDAILDREMNKVLRGIPQDAQAKALAYASIEKALFELGTGFRVNLDNFEKSNETLFKLLERFPETDNKAEAFYFIHLNFLDLEKNAMAESYKNRLINQFPESDFAIFLKNPSGNNTLITEERKIEIYYEETYKLFEQGLYSKSHDRLIQAEAKFPKDHFMMAKYDLLKAMCLGNLKGQAEYVNALRKVILKYENSPEQVYAREMLRFVRGDQDAFVGDVSEEDVSKFSVDAKKLHYMVAVVYDVDGNQMKNVKQQIDTFNDKNYPTKRLRSTSLAFSKENSSYVVLIRRFTDQTDAMNYYKNASGKLDQFLDTKKYSFDIFAINVGNYRKVIAEKTFNSYRVFFEKEFIGIK